MRESLAGKVAVVTGGNSGIGAAIVELLTEAGATCHAVGRRGPVKVDVSDHGAVRKFAGRSTSSTPAWPSSASRAEMWS